jgi:hypothetical protein
MRVDNISVGPAALGVIIGGSGDTVVLLPYTGGDVAQLDRFAPVLHEAGFPDCCDQSERGFGKHWSTRIRDASRSRCRRSECDRRVRNLRPSMYSALPSELGSPGAWLPTVQTLLER